MNAKINIIIIIAWLSIMFFDSNAMDCSEKCKNVKNYEECLSLCIIRKYNIKTSMPSASQARKEWFKRYPCPMGEESDCYYPYRGDYVEGIRRDDNRKAHRDKD